MALRLPKVQVCSHSGAIRARMCKCALLVVGCGCVRPVNYAEVRTRVARAYEEKAFEMSQATDVLQSLSRQTVALIADVEKRCG